jgi:DNA-binding transcriptional MerR regulator
MSKFLAPADAARILNLTPATVRSLETRGILQAEKTISGRRFFRLADVEKLAAEREQKARAAASVDKKRG